MTKNSDSRLTLLKHRYRVAVCCALARYAEEGYGLHFSSEGGDGGRLVMTFELGDPAAYDTALREEMATVMDARSSAEL